MSESTAGAVPPGRIADLIAVSAATILAELQAIGPDGGWRPEPGEARVWEQMGNARRFSLEDL